MKQEKNRDWHSNYGGTLVPTPPKNSFENILIKSKETKHLRGPNNIQEIQLREYIGGESMFVLRSSSEIKGGEEFH